jgi:hypothetical protein
MQAPIITVDNFNPRAQIDPTGSILVLQGAGVIAPDGLIPPYAGRTTGWRGQRPAEAFRQVA